MPIFILSSPRTGSSLLGEICANHPDIEDCGEALNQRIARGLYHRAIGSGPVIRHIKHHLAISNSRYATIKIHYNHLRDRETSIEDLIQAFPDAMWIVLYRQKLIDQYISLQLAISTRTFTGSVRKRELVCVDEADWRLFVDSEKSNIRTAIKLLSTHNPRFISIAYEDFSTNGEVFLAHLSSLLEIPAPPHFETKLQKQETRPVSEVIANFDSVRNSIGDTISLSDLENH